MRFLRTHCRRLLFRLAVVVLAAGQVAVAIAAGSLNLASYRSRVQLAEPPGDARQVLDEQKRFVAAKSQPEVPPTREVIVTGQIGGMPNVWPDSHPEFPWYRGQASFFLVDNRTAAEFAAHAKKYGSSEKCVYCKNLAAQKAHAVAVVNFRDEDGQILRVDTRQLLGLKENQRVTVRGQARLVEGRMLVIDADGIYVRR